MKRGPRGKAGCAVRVRGPRRQLFTVSVFANAGTLSTTMKAAADRPAKSLCIRNSFEETHRSRGLIPRFNVSVKRRSLDTTERD